MKKGKIMEHKDFYLWERECFGYGYGSGEFFIFSAMKRMFKLFNKDGQYDYEILENEIGTAITLLLINALCTTDIIEYGTSPRFGWLTDKGIELKEFMDNKTEHELTELICNVDEDTALEFYSGEE